MAQKYSGYRVYPDTKLHPYENAHRKSDYKIFIQFDNEFIDTELLDWGYVGIRPYRLAEKILHDYYGDITIPSDLIWMFVRDAIRHLPVDEWEFTKTDIDEFMQIMLSKLEGV